MALVSIFRAYYEHVAQLTDDQLSGLGTVAWLLSNSDQSVRASGRSLLMALSFVRDAALMPGKWTKVWDHHDPGRPGKRFMMEKIRSLFPDGVEISEDAIMVHEGWPHNRMDKVPKDSRSRIHEMLIGDVKSAAIAAFRTGVAAEDVFAAVKEALVQCVMEA